MAKTPSAEIAWLPQPEEHNYPAAESYLSLLMPTARAKKHAAELKAAPMSSFKAKDVLRASQLSMLGINNSHVESNLAKIRKGTPLSPLLLLRDEDRGRVVVADGYHRLCAVYQLDEDAVIPCKIV